MEILNIIHAEGWRVAFRGAETGAEPYMRALACFALVTEGQGSSKEFRVVGLCSHGDSKKIEVCEKENNFIGYLAPNEALNRYAKEAGLG